MLPLETTEGSQLGIGGAAEPPNNSVSSHLCAIRLHYVLGISVYNACGISVPLSVGFVFTVYVVFLNSVWHFVPSLQRLCALVFGVCVLLSVALLCTVSVAFVCTVSVALVCIVYCLESDIQAVELVFHWNK